MTGDDRRAALARARLYLCTPDRADLAGFVTAVCRAGVDIVQLRDKELDDRALLLDPRILILDDSTSSVDLATEYRIQQALTQLMKGRTSFVIAQRISTVVNADQILVLERGQIVARGTHEELLETSEIYADIYTSQLMEDVVVEQPALELAQA